MMDVNGDYYLLGGVLVIIGNVVMIDWATAVLKSITSRKDFGLLKVDAKAAAICRVCLSSSGTGVNSYPTNTLDKRAFGSYQRKGYRHKTQQLLLKVSSRAAAACLDNNVQVVYHHLFARIRKI